MIKNVRRITNRFFASYYVGEIEGDKVTGYVYDDFDDIPEPDIRAVAKRMKNVKPMYVGPNMANRLGVQDKLYPDFPKKCNNPEFSNDFCIAEDCKYVSHENWSECPYFRSLNSVSED